MADGTITGVIPGIGIAGGGHADQVEVSLDPSGSITFSGPSLARQNDPPAGARTVQIPNCRWVMSQLDTHGGGGPGFDSVNPSVNAAGTNQSGATHLESQTSLVTGGSGGVRWDSPEAGDHRFVHNGTATAITFYPPSGAQINNLTANTGIFIQPNVTAFVKAVTPSRLITVP